MLPLNRQVGRLSRLPLTLTLILFFVLPALHLRGADGARRPFALPVADAEVTLELFSEQAGVQLVYLIENVRGVATNPVQGTFAPRDALERLVADTALRVEVDGKTGAFVVKHERAGPVSPSSHSGTPADPSVPVVKNKTSLSRLGAWLALTFAPLSVGAGEPAKSDAAADEAVKLETFTVTGTNVKRLDQEKVLPVLVLTAADLEIRDASQPADLLLGLSQVNSLPNNETSTLNNTARGDNANISLRGIPSGNTLVLLNGRRLVPHAISQAEGGTPSLSVNVNQLPNRGLQQVDVLKDGASSIYGTDAVAGVVNYVTRRDFIGTELALRFAQTNYHDGEEYRATLTHGLTFAGGKGRALVTADYYIRQPILVRDRPFAAEADISPRAPAPWNTPTNTTFNFRSASTEYGNFTLGSTNAAGTFVGARPTGIPSTLAAASGVWFLAPNGNGTQFLTATPSRVGATHDYYWNSNVYRSIQPKSKRANLFASGDYQLSDRLSLFGDIGFYNARSTTFREPDFVNVAVDGNIVIPATNPWNPFGTRFWSPTGAPNADGSARLTGTPSDVLISNKRFVDLRTRTADINSSVYRGLLGARGKIFDTWRWESAALYSAGRVVDRENNSSRKSKLIAAINQTDPAKAFNPFTRTFAVQNGALVVTGDHVNPASVQDTFLDTKERSGRTQLASLDANAFGDVARLWGGNSISAAIGVEGRYEAYDDRRPPFSGLNPAGSGLDPNSADFLSYLGIPNTSGHRYVSAAYAETAIPLVGGQFKLPLVHSLAVNASGRFENYSDFGRTTKPKFGVNWHPLSWAMVRGSYNQGFLAPNLAQLFTGDLRTTLVSVTDNYRSAVTGLPLDGATNRINVASGNQKLNPESSKGKTVGLVVQVPQVRGLSFSVDYWEIARANIISSGGGIGDDTAVLNAYTQAQLAAGQAIASIDTGSGTANYKGDPSVVRLPLTSADRDFFTAYNARVVPGNQRAAVGAIDYVRSTYFNKSREFVNGFDFDVNYRLPRLALGRVTFNTNWSYLVTQYSYTSAASRRTDLRAWNPLWKGSATVSWTKGSWGAGFGLYYTARFTSGATTSLATWNSLGNPTYIQPVFTDGSTQYRLVVHDTKTYNTYVTYRFAEKAALLRGTSLRLGAVNLLDTKPPLSNDSRGYDVGRYNSLARGVTWSLQLTKTL